MTPKALKSTAQTLARQPWFVAVGKHTIPRLDRVLYKVTGGRYGAMSPSGIPGLLLTTVGRKTGKERSVPLLYVEHEGKYYLTGSNWGQEHHPVWTLNLMANPEATLTIKGKKIPVTARLLEGEERTGIWPVLIETWPNFDVYTERSGRELRVFELTPR
jgi:deazaflavin-dependent oxidoreductase (nitroreductase family)